MTENQLLSLNKHPMEKRLSLIEELFPEEMSYLRSKIFADDSFLYKLYSVSVEKGVMSDKEFLGFFKQPDNIIEAIGSLSDENINWIFIKVFKYGFESGIQQTILLYREKGEWTLLKKEVF